MAEEAKKKRDRGLWFREMKSELKKVVWPSKQTVAKNTGTVLLCSLLIGCGTSPTQTSTVLPCFLTTGTCFSAAPSDVLARSAFIGSPQQASVGLPSMTVAIFLQSSQ